MVAIFLSLLFACLYIRSSTSQQVGSFFTAVYINGNLASTQVSCSGMGQPSYCCGSGQYCALDGSRNVACCPVGMTCQGHATVAPQYTQTTSIYQSPQTTTAYLQQTTTVYSQEITTTTPGIFTTTIVPAVVPYTVVGQQSTVSATYAPVTTYAPAPVTTTTVRPANCAAGFSTITMAGVGTPTLQSGCLLIVNSGKRTISFQHGTIGLSFLSMMIFLSICL